MSFFRIFTALFLPLLCLVFCSTARAEPGQDQFSLSGSGKQTLDVGISAPDTDIAAENSRMSRTQKAWALNLGAMGTVMAWGIINWDYFSRAPAAENEKWFGHDTRNGGADKLGHLWASYAMSHGFAALYTHFGYAEAQAQIYGPLSALTITGIMEIGDSFSSEHGFSYEDMVANAVGAGIGWFLLRYPKWRKRIDLRWEYAPEFNDLEGDITTDYEHSKYLLALKAEGFDCIKNPYLKCLELHLGYYARGYAEHHDFGADKRRRYIYAGAGINIGRLINHIWDTPIFNYIQVPYTYAEVRTSLE